MGEDFNKKRKQRHASGESTYSTESMSNYIPTPPDGGWGWVIVFASFINHVIVDGITFTFGMFYMEFLEYFQASKGKTALVGSLLAGFYLMSGPISSALVNKYGCRPVCIAGSIISSCAFILATFSNTINVLMLTYGCMAGFGFGMIYLPSVVSVSYYFEKKRAIATGIAVCGAGVGGFVFAPVGRIMMQTFDWKNSLYIVAGLTLNAAVCGMLMRPLEPPKKKKPRRKNFLDRLREQAFQRKTSTAHGVCGINSDEAIMERVMKVKLEREQRLHEEEDNSEVSSFLKSDGVVANGKATQNALETVSLPNNPADTLTVTANNPVRSPSGDVPNQVDENEKAKMLVSEGKTVEFADEASSPRKSISALPPHIRREVFKNGFAGMFTPSNTKEPTTNGHTNGLLVPNGNKNHHFSFGDVMTFTPHVRPRRPEGVEREDYARPLYRRDIFYSGSVLHIAQFRSSPDVKTYVTSITTIPGEVAPEKESRFWKSVPIGKAAKDILRAMLDVSLLKDPVFLIALLGEVFGFIGLFIPFVFITERAIALGIPDQRAAFLLSVIGITNTVGRIIAGYMADLSWCDSLLLHNLMMIIGGLACIFNMFATTYTGMVVFAAVFGLSVATYISLTSIILCNLMGLEKLTSAFGFLTLVRGISSIAGSPIAGMVFDMTGDYDMSFHVGGSMFLLAGLFYCILHLPVFQRNRVKKPADDVEIENVEDGMIPPIVMVDDEDAVFDGVDDDEFRELQDVDLGIPSSEATI